MKTTWLVLAGVTLLASACSGGDPNEVGELRPYVNAALGFRVDYPSNWQVVEDPDFLVGDAPNKLHAVMFLRDQAAGVLFTVLIQQLDGEKSLADYGQEQMAGARSQAAGATYSELAPTTLGGVPALAAQTRVEQGGQAHTQRVMLAVSNGHGYGVSIVTPDGSPLTQTMDEMLATFRFLP